MGSVRRVWSALTDWSVPNVLKPYAPTFLGGSWGSSGSSSSSNNSRRPGGLKRPRDRPKSPPRRRRPSQQRRRQQTSPFQRHVLPPGARESTPAPAPGMGAKWHKHVRRRRPSPQSVRRKTQDVLWHRLGIVPSREELKNKGKNNSNNNSVYYYYQPPALPSSPTT